MVQGLIVCASAQTKQRTFLLYRHLFASTVVVSLIYSRSFVCARCKNVVNVHKRDIPKMFDSKQRCTRFCLCFFIVAQIDNGMTMAWQCVDSKRWIKPKQPWTIIYLLLSVIIFAFCSWRNLIQICCVQRAHNDHYHYASPSGREHLWIYVFVCVCVQ